MVNNRVNQKLFNEGINQLIKNQYQQAINTFQTLYQKNPNHYGILNSLALAYMSVGESSQAIELFKKIIQIKPSQTSNRCNLILLYLKQKKYDKAYDETLSLLEIDLSRTDFYQKIILDFIHKNQTILAYRLFKSIKNKISIDPLTKINYILGCQLEDKKLIEEAIDVMKIGFYHTKKKKYLYKVLEYYGKYQKASEAIAYLEILLQQDPTPDIYSAISLIHFKYHADYEKAIQYANEGLAVFPKNKEICNALGNIHMHQHQYDQAVLAFEEIGLPILSLYHQSAKQTLQNLTEPDAHALVHLAFLYRITCHFRKYNPLIKIVHQMIDYFHQQQKPIPISPFQSLIMLDIPKYHRIVTKDFMRAFPIQKTIKHYPPKDYNDIIHVGYISGDFNKHAIGLLLQDLFSHHSRQQFKVFGYNTSNITDEYTVQLQKTFDKYVSLGHMNDEEAAATISQDRIDLLIDLSSVTVNARPGILAYQPATIQCHYLGLLSTLEVPYIQYHIATRDMITPDMENLFSEKIAFLPQCYFAIKPFKQPLKASRQHFGLPDNSFVFCNFSASYRLDESTLVAWFNILKQVPNAVLWLKQASPSFIVNIQNLAQSHDVNPDRIVFLKIELLSQSWPMQVADLWLEPFCHSSGTAVFMCLSIGIPVLAQQGLYPHQRLSSNTLRACGIPELIATSTENYCQQAVYIANHSDVQVTLKTKLEQAKQQTNLFQPETFIKELESVYLDIVTAHLPQK